MPLCLITMEDVNASDCKYQIYVKISIDSHSYSPLHVNCYFDVNSQITESVTSGFSMNALFTVEMFL